MLNMLPSQDGCKGPPEVFMGNFSIVNFPICLKYSKEYSRDNSGDKDEPDLMGECYHDPGYCGDGS